MLAELDSLEAHRHFAAHCFNQAWHWMQKPQRTPEENLQMLELAYASVYHWRQHPEGHVKNLCIAYWQISRVHALLGQASEARRYAQVCMGYSLGLTPFLQGYAYEALARAAWLAGERAELALHLAMAQKQAALVNDPNERQLLERDLQSLWLGTSRS